MKYIYFFILSVFIVGISQTSFAQDSDWATKKYELNDFRDIYLKGSYKVFLIQGKENSLTVKASDDDVLITWKLIIIVLLLAWRLIESTLISIR